MIPTGYINAAAACYSPYDLSPSYRYHNAFVSMTSLPFPVLPASVPVAFPVPNTDVPAPSSFNAAGGYGFMTSQVEEDSFQPTPPQPHTCAHASSGPVSATSHDHRCTSELAALLAFIDRRRHRDRVSLDRPYMSLISLILSKLSNQTNVVASQHVTNTRQYTNASDKSKKKKPIMSLDR